jgi:hypothetical protein
MDVLTSAMAALDASGEEADVSLAGLHFLWCLAKGNTVNRVRVLNLLVCCEVSPSSCRKLKSWLVCMMHMQVPLMSVVDSAVRVWDAHRGDVRVARVGLGLLTHLATDKENRVCVQSRRAI